MRRVGGGPFGLKPGQWTDDKSMALCLADSLIKKCGFDPKDQMDRYCRWRKEGYLSSTGTCFDIRITVKTALADYLRTGEPLVGSTDPFTAGNGSCLCRSTWDAASWHASKKFYGRVAEVNEPAYRAEHGTPAVEPAPLPSCAQFLNVIEVGSYCSVLLGGYLNGPGYDGYDSIFPNPIPPISVQTTP